jgi:puromycin-sensitive aminopeptidase
MAVSNGRETSITTVGHTHKAVAFAETMVMSTYLVAFVVGPFEATPAVDMGGVPLRVIAPRGKLRLARFALDIGTFSTEFFAEYTGIPYPADKLDLIAVPDFAFGAMENLACVTFRTRRPPAAPSWSESRTSSRTRSPTCGLATW